MEEDYLFEVWHLIRLARICTFMCVVERERERERERECVCVCVCVYMCVYNTNLCMYIPNYLSICQSIYQSISQSKKNKIIGALCCVCEEEEGDR